MGNIANLINYDYYDSDFYELRSTNVLNIMEELGFKEIHHIKGGILQ